MRKHIPHTAATQNRGEGQYNTLNRVRQREHIQIRNLCDGYGIGSATRDDGTVRIDLGLNGQSARTLREAERILQLYGY